MSESVPVNLQAFAPFKGGRGERLSVTTSSAAARIPGLSGGIPAPNTRVLIANGGAVSVFVVMGNSDVVADLDCLEILPRCAYLLAPPTAGPTGIWIAAISETSPTKISVVSGEGT